MRTLKIATRKSALALWQANYVKQQLQHHHPELTVELVELVSQGDKILDAPLSKIGGKGLFVKELENALLAGEADIAVHSMKDVPMHFPDGLGLGVICPREDPRDAFVSNHFENLAALPRGAVVGTSSLRRQCQILSVRPDLTIKFLRGNINTRLEKLDRGEYDAIILATAGLIRLGMQDRIKDALTPELCLPAPGQGAVGIELRLNDIEVMQLIEPLHCLQTTLRVKAERAMNTHLNGGCQVPIAGFALIEGDEIYLRGMVGNPDGCTLYRSEIRAPLGQVEQAGIHVAQSLLDQGADHILATLYDHRP